MALHVKLIEANSYEVQIIILFVSSSPPQIYIHTIIDLFKILIIFFISQFTDYFKVFFRGFPNSICGTVYTYIFLLLFTNCKFL